MSNPSAPAPSSITKVHFDNLPPATQQKLLTRQDASQADQFRFKTGGNLGAWFVAVLGLGWFLLLAVLADDNQWDSSEKVAYAVLTALSALMLAWGVRRIVRYRRARLKNFTYLTPLYVIKTKLDEVTYWPLWDLVNFQVTNHHTNGAYTHSSVEMTFKEAKETFIIKRKDEVDNLAATLRSWGDQLQQARARSDWQFFATRDDFYELRSGQQPQQQPAPTPPRSALSKYALLAAPLAGLVIFALASFANNYLGDKKSWDNARAVDSSSSYRFYLAAVPGGRWRADAERLYDEKSWEEARRAASASAYRKYLADFPGGRFRSEAEAAIAGSYDNSARNYVSKRSTGFDAQASEVVTALLERAKTTKDYRVRVAFERHNVISEQDVKNRFQKRFGQLSLISMGDSFSDSKMQSREQNIFRVIKSAFGEVIPGDVLEFTDTGDPATHPVFVVSYTVNSGDSLYYRDSDSYLPALSRPYYPGILFDWDFKVRIPGREMPYNFKLQSRPSSTINYQTSSTAASAGSESATIYDQMAVSAFDNFRGELVRRFGLR